MFAGVCSLPSSKFELPVVQTQSPDEPAYGQGSAFASQNQMRQGTIVGINLKAGGRRRQATPLWLHPAVCGTVFALAVPVIHSSCMATATCSSANSSSVPLP